MDVTSADGAFYSNGAQLGIQLLGVLVTVTWSVLWTYLLSWLIRLTVSDLIFGLDLFEWNTLHRITILMFLLEDVETYC